MSSATTRNATGPSGENSLTRESSLILTAAARGPDPECAVPAGARDLADIEIVGACRLEPGAYLRFDSEGDFQLYISAPELLTWRRSEDDGAEQ